MGPLNSDSLPNLLRLQSLKNVSGRRKVLPGAQYLQDLENYESDVGGTSQPMLDIPPPEMMDNSTPQASDIRANVVQPTEQPMQEEEPSMWSKLGQSLANFANYSMPKEGSSPQTPPIETAQVEASEGLPVGVQATPQGGADPRFLGQLGSALSSTGQAVKDYFNPSKREQMGYNNEQERQNTQIKMAGGDPNQIRQSTDQGFMQDIEKAMQNPWQDSVYGSSDIVANHPALQQEFKQKTGIDFEPVIAKQVSEYEAAMKGVEDSLNGIQTALGEKEEGIKQRILNNQSTDADKFYIGLALLLPLVIGATMGKEAGIGALGGAAKGIADVYARRDKDLRTDEESLLDIAKQQGVNAEKLGNLNLEKAKLRPTLEKNLPDQPNEHLLGMSEVTWTNPDTGQQESAVRIMPGLVAKSEYVNRPDGLKEMRKAASELSEVKSYVDELDDLTNDVVKIASQLKDKNFFSKMFSTVMSGQAPGALSKITEDVIFDGRKVNAGTLLEEKLGFLANAYGQAKQLGQLDRAAQNHMQKLMNNPTSSLASPRDVVNQMLEIRKLAQRGLVKSAENKGFISDFLKEEMEEKNNQLLQGLNQKESDNRTQEIKKKMLQSETNYANKI